MTIKGLLASIITASLLVSCGNKVFNKYKHTSAEGWEKNDTVSFSVPKMQASGTYNLSLGLRVNDQYPFTTLSLIVEQKAYPNKTLKTDTINCSMVGRSGNPKVQGISYHQYHFKVTQYHLNKGDSLHITIRHNMQREILPGISDIGIQMEMVNSSQDGIRAS